MSRCRSWCGRVSWITWSDLHAHYFSAVLPNATLVLYPQEGHLLLVQHWGEILAAVSAGAETKDPAAGRHKQGGQAAPS